MIPFIRTITELMILTEARDKYDREIDNYDHEHSKAKETQSQNYIKSVNRKAVNLPIIPENTKQKWIKRKKAVSKFFDELDYNNQIQSSYDLTLLESQKNYDQDDVA